MTPTELYLWRDKHGISQTRLANLLGKHKNTVVNWEKGHTRLPKGFEGMLRDILPFLPNAVSVDGAPAYVTPKTNPELYERQGGELYAGPFHPRTLLGADAEDETRRVPWSMLKDPRYKAALDAARANRPLDGASPEDMARIGERRRLDSLSIEEQEEAAYCKSVGIPWRHWVNNVSADKKRELMVYWRSHRRD